MALHLSIQVEDRQAAERRDMQDKVSFGPVKNVGRDGLSIASYCGLDQVAAHPFATVVLASEDSAWTVFYETLENTPTSFCSRAESMFASIREAKKRWSTL